MIKVHLKQGGHITVASAEKGEWWLRYQGYVRFLEMHKKRSDGSDKYFSIPMENVLFIEEIIDKPE